MAKRKGSAFVNPKAYPGWPQMAGSAGPNVGGQSSSGEMEGATGVAPAPFKPNPMSDIAANPDKYRAFAGGGAVKDLRAIRRNYAKGGPIF